MCVVELIKVVCVREGLEWDHIMLPELCRDVIACEYGERAL